eukprot:scaffold35985_cov283-Amphora_coffeaeformis.AAC.1
MCHPRGRNRTTTPNHRSDEARAWHSPCVTFEFPCGSVPPVPSWLTATTTGRPQTRCDDIANAGPNDEPSVRHVHLRYANRVKWVFLVERVRDTIPWLCCSVGSNSCRVFAWL